MTCYTWLDNDEAGEKAMKAFSEFLAHEKIQHIGMNDYNALHKDVNEFHMAMLAKKTGASAEQIKLDQYSTKEKSSYEISS